MGREGYIELLKKNNIQFSENEAMASHTSFKIGGGADLFVCPDSVDKLRFALSFAKEKGLPYFILGNGSNLLVSDKGIEGVVLSTSCLKKLTLTDEETVFAEAGATLASLCVFAKDNGLTGLEFAYGIPGSVGGALYMNAGAYGGDMAEVICDSQGIHVEPDLLRLILLVKGVDHTVLISDSYVSNEPTPPEFAHITDLQFDANGGLCGSKLTLDVACRNMMKHTGCSMNDAFLLASRNPARAIGLDREVGTLEIGKRANLVIVDGEFNVQSVMLDGRFVSFK